MVNLPWLVLDNQSRDLLHVDHGKTIFWKPKLIRVLPSAIAIGYWPSAIDIALTNSSTYTTHSSTCKDFHGMETEIL